MPPNPRSLLGPLYL